MARAIIHSPLLHAGSHAVGEAATQRLLIVDGINESIIGVLVKIFIHLRTVEYILAIVFIRTFARDSHRYRFASVGLFYHFKS